jgi:2-oxoglutarate ferredoxin oxidoreductase subunit alpha
MNGFARYEDVDGDGICYRTLPGTKHNKAAYFTRGTGHNERAQYSERPVDWVRNIDRLGRKFEMARSMVPTPVIDRTEGAEIGVIGCGTSDYAIIESCDQLSNEHSIRTSYLRLRAFPFNQEVEDFIRRHDRTYVIDQNRDGQLWQLLQMETPAELHTRLRSVRYYGGMPLDARTVTDEIMEQEGL